MSRQFSNHTNKTPAIISLALLLLGGLGFWQATGGSVTGSGEKPGVFAEGVHVVFAPHSEQCGLPKKTGERQLAGDDNGSPFWLFSRTPDLITAFLSEPFPVSAARDFVSGAAPYSPQIPRAPPLA